MSFDSPDDAAAAYESFKADGYTVYPDKLYDDDMVDSSNVTYSQMSSENMGQLYQIQQILFL